LRDNNTKKTLIIVYLRGYLEEFPLNSLSLMNQPLEKLPNNKTQSVIEVLINKALQSFESGKEKVKTILYRKM